MNPEEAQAFTNDLLSSSDTIKRAEEDYYKAVEALTEAEDNAFLTIDFKKKGITNQRQREAYVRNETTKERVAVHKAKVHLEAYKRMFEVMKLHFMSVVYEE